MIQAKPSTRATILLVAFVLTLGLLPGVASADTRSVNCPGRHIASALRLPAGRALTIIVNGTCNENVTITRDDVTLKAGPAGATINGTDPAQNTILIDGVKNVVIDGLTVSGARSGIAGTNGAVFTVQNAVVQDNAQNGVVAISGSTVTVQNSQLINNGKHSGQDGDPARGRSGLSINDNSSATVIGSTLSGNVSNGIFVARSSSARIGLTSRNVAGKNTIKGNGKGHGSSGIFVFQASAALIYCNEIGGATSQEGNDGSGISVDGGTAVIALNTIRSNGGNGITVTNGGGARIGLNDSNLAPNNSNPTASDHCPIALPTHPNGTAVTNHVASNGANGLELSNGANGNFYGNLIETNNNRGVIISTGTGRSPGNNTIRNNGDDGICVCRGQFLQSQFASLAPNTRDLITGNGTAMRDDPATGFGVLVFGDSTANLQNFEISDNRRDGITVFSGASAILRSEDPAQISVIQNNGVLKTDSDHGLATGTGPAPYSSSGSGISASNGGSVEVRGVIVRNNKVHGISLSGRSVASIRAHVLDNGNGATMKVEISGNALNGVNVFNGSVVDISRNTTITNNGTANTPENPNPCGSAPLSPCVVGGFPAGNGISISNNSAANISDSSITSNKASGITLSGNSTLNIGASATLFPPIGDITPGSVVNNNGLDGISASSNSVVNLFSATVTDPPPTFGNPPSGAQAVTQVTGNGRSGLSCGSLSRVQGTLTGIVNNHTSGSGADLSGSVLVTSNSGSNATPFQVPDTNIPATARTVMTTTPLTTNGGTCF